MHFSIKIHSVSNFGAANYNPQVLQSELNCPLYHIHPQVPQFISWHPGDAVFVVGSTAGKIQVSWYSNATVTPSHKSVLIHFNPFHTKF